MNSENVYYRKNFGPVIEYFLARLDDYIKYFDDGETQFLFCSRAGVSIFDLYKAYLDKRGETVPESCSKFWVSRFLCCKSLLSSGSEAAQSLLLNEYRGHSAEDFIKGMFHGEPDDWGQGVKFDAIKDQTASDYIRQLLGNTYHTGYMWKYLRRLENDFDAYVDEVTNGNKRVVLVDSGWQGTIQTLLSFKYPDREFHGFLFGRIDTPTTDRRCFNRMYGLVFEISISGKFCTYNPKVPQTAFALHRHLIEDLFEPSFKSVESIHNLGDVYGPPNLSELAGHDVFHDRPRLNAVREHILASETVPSKVQTHGRFATVMRELAQKIIHPSDEDLKHLGGLRRSMDFGRPGSVAVLLEPEDRFKGDAPEKRVRASLWSQGQIALEYDSETAVKLQSARLVTPFQKKPLVEGGRVAIITRTKNRPILLKRAAQSVRCQTYGNYLWVVVNDGGEKQPVEDAILRSGLDLSKVVLVNNPESLGMEAASNRGIANSESDYIVIHDDDDSWEPEFLEKAVEFLEGKPEGVFGGVMTGTTYVSEEILGTEVKIHGRKPYNDWVKSVHLAEMAAGNFFAPIAFVFKRSVYEEIGGYDEYLPVLGDWDFNLRFLCRTNIGVVPEPLANYHHRDINVDANSQYSNSVIGGVSKHQEYDPVVRNKYIRQGQEGYEPLSHILSTGYAQGALRSQVGALNELNHHISSLHSQMHEVMVKLGSVSSPDCKPYLHDVKCLLGQLKKAEKVFDNEYYLDVNPDVSAAVSKGDFKSGLQHFLSFGWSEFRDYRLKE